MQAESAPGMGVYLDYCPGRRGAGSILMFVHSRQGIWIAMTCPGSISVMVKQKRPVRFAAGHMPSLINLWAGLAVQF